MIPAIVILSGGSSRRFGSEKAFARLLGKSLVEYLIDFFSEQTDAPLAINAAENSQYRALEKPLIPDQLAGPLGPLAGIHAAMNWADSIGCQRVVTTPVDTPILPQQFVADLSKHKEPAFSMANGKNHPLHGIWPVDLKDELASMISMGMRSGLDWCDHCRAKTCEFDIENDQNYFYNVNTPEDMAHLGVTLSG